MHFTVGHKIDERTNHVVVEAVDALAAALQVKSKCPDTTIMYVRPTNKRGDARHPAADYSAADA